MTWRESVATEVSEILERIAREKRTISYSELVEKINTQPAPEPSSTALAEILDEISTRSDAGGKGMLSALVIHKGDDELPGSGFFALARVLGRDTSDKGVFYVTERHRVHKAFER